MPRGTSAEERATATLITAGDVPPLDDDIDQAFEEWRSSFNNAETPGQIAAFQVPMDERGNVNLTTKTQIRLGTWAIDLYSFDELCAMIIRDYMVPANEKIMAVRFLGTRKGERGIQFNKVVVLRPPAQSAQTAAPAGESTAALLKAFQEMNERTIALIRSLVPEKPVVDPYTEITRMMTFAKQMSDPTTELLKILLPAIIGRPAPAASDPFVGLNGMLDAAERIADMRGGGGMEDKGDADSLGGIIRSLVPIAKPALEALPAILSQQPARPAPPPVRPQPRPVAGPPPGMQPTQPQPQPTAPLPPVASPTDIPTEDAAMFAQLKPQIDSLCTMAGQGSDPIGAADLLYDQLICDLPDEIYDKVAEMIESPNFIRNAAVFNPAVNTVKDWFEKLRAQVILRINQADAEAGQEPTQP